MVDFFIVPHSIVSIAISYQDRFLATPTGSEASINREVFRVASVTCLYIAIKLYVPHKWNVTAHAFAQLCRGSISGESIVKMEMRILFALEWNVHPPVPMLYVELITDLIIATSPIRNEEQRQDHQVSDEDSVLGDLILPSLSNASYSEHSITQECTSTVIVENILDLVRYQVDLALQKIDFLYIRSSLISLAAMLNAIEGILSQNDPNVTSFCSHSVEVIAKLMSYSDVCSKRELDEVRAVLLCSVMAESGGSFESSMLLQDYDKDTDDAVKPPTQQSMSTSPTSASTNWNQHGHYLSPKSVLSKVCAMHCKCSSNIT